MGFTQKEILAALEESYRNKWNLRQMTALREEGFLPPLKRETRPGTNKPQYVWDETDINQIVDVYDWWDYCDGAQKILAGLAVPDTEDEGFWIQFQKVATTLRGIFSLPHLLEAIRTATPEQWQLARKDYLDLCHVLGVIEERRTSNGGELLPEKFLIGLKITGALWLAVPLLSIRYRGYGQWIDEAFENIHAFLDDPAIQEQILNKSKPGSMIEADTGGKDKPELSIS